MSQSIRVHTFANTGSLVRGPIGSVHLMVVVEINLDHGFACTCLIYVESSY